MIVNEIGDKKQERDYPQLKTIAWNNESNISLRLLEDYTDGRIITDGMVDKYMGKNYEAHFYPFGNGYEFTVYLKKKPVNPWIDFTVETKNANVFYQGALSSKEISNGSIRSDIVVGSLAVYHSYKRDNLYKVGKICHIYRPFAIDSLGIKRYCSTQYKNGVYRVFIPDIIYNGSYPIIIDPTFGYESAGASTVSCKNRIWASVATMGGTGGTVDNLSAYISASHNGQNIGVCGAIYDESAGSPNSLLTNGQTNEIFKDSVTAEWRNLTFSTAPSVSASTNYWLCIWGENIHTNVYPYIHYDTTTHDTSYDNEAYGSSPSYPSSFTEDETYSNRILSIHADYTESGGGGSSIPVFIKHLRNQRIT